MDKCKLTKGKCIRCTEGKCEYRKTPKLTEKQKQTVLEMCENDMNITEVARAMNSTAGTVQSQLALVWEKTGLNPKCFYDLVELMDMIRGEA